MSPIHTDLIYLAALRVGGKEFTGIQIVDGREGALQKHRPQLPAAFAAQVQLSPGDYRHPKTGQHGLAIRAPTFIEHRATARNASDNVGICLDRLAFNVAPDIRGNAG